MEIMTVITELLLPSLKGPWQPMRYFLWFERVFAECSHTSLQYLDYKKEAVQVKKEDKDKNFA